MLSLSLLFFFLLLNSLIPLPFLSLSLLSYAQSSSPAAAKKLVDEGITTLEGIALFKSLNITLSACLRRTYWFRSEEAPREVESSSANWSKVSVRVASVSSSEGVLPLACLALIKFSPDTLLLISDVYTVRTWACLHLTLTHTHTHVHTYTHTHTHTHVYTFYISLVPGSNSFLLSLFPSLPPTPFPN